MITGRDLRTARERRGMSLGRVGTIIHRSKSQLSRIERGREGRVTESLIRDYERALGISFEAVASQGEREAVSQALAASMGTPEEIDNVGLPSHTSAGTYAGRAYTAAHGSRIRWEASDVYRREMQALFSGPPADDMLPYCATGGDKPPPWEEVVAQQSVDFATRARRTAMDPLLLERIEEDLRRISWEYLYSPRPRAHFNELVLVRDRTFRQIESERPRPDQSRLLHSFAGITCALLAQSTHELGYRRAAMSHAHAAFVCAELAGHVTLQVWIRATQAAIAEYAGLPREAVRYAEAGRQLPSRGTAMVRLLSLGANGHARLGDLHATRTALAAAEEARESVADDDPLDEIGGVLSVSLAKQHAYAASALALLNRGPDAAQQARKALELYQAAPAAQRQPVNEAYAHIDIAYARLLGDEIDGVGDALAPVLTLPPHARVDLLDEKLRRLHRQLSESAQSQERTTRELQGRIEEFIAAMSIASRDE